MTPDELSSLLRISSTDAGERGPTCPDEHSIAAYVDGMLGTDDREPLELHLADCSHCLALVGLLSREHGVAATEAVPDQTVAQARALAKPNFRRQPFRTPAWAAAAVVVLAVAVLISLPRPADTGWSPDAPATRTSNSRGLQLLSPGEGTTVDRAQLTIRWSPVSGARYYDVRVVTEAGDVVAEQRLTGTEWHPASRAALRPDLEYFVRVDAYVSEGNAIGSEHVSFYVSE